MRRPILITGALILILSVLFCIQGLSVKQLKRENDVLHAELQSLKAKPAEIPDQQVAPGPDQSELLRLRGEAAELRQSLTAAEAMIESLTNSPVETNDSPVENYLINANTNLTWGQTLVVGGFKLTADKRSFVFIQATDGMDGKFIGLRIRLVEMSEQMISLVGLEALKSESRLNSKSVVVSANETERVIGTLKNAGVKFRADTYYRSGATRGQDGREVWVGYQVTLPLTTDNNRPSGTTLLTSATPVLIFTPTVTPDRQSIQLIVSGLINYPH